MMSVYDESFLQLSTFLVFLSCVVLLVLTADNHLPLHRRRLLLFPLFLLSGWVFGNWRVLCDRIKRPQNYPNLHTHALTQVKIVLLKILHVKRVILKCPEKVENVSMHLDILARRDFDRCATILTKTGSVVWALQTMRCA